MTGSRLLRPILFAHFAKRVIGAVRNQSRHDGHGTLRLLAWHEMFSALPLAASLTGLRDDVSECAVPLQLDHLRDERPSVSRRREIVEPVGKLY
jgi:hypothetical protein